MKPLNTKGDWLALLQATVAAITVAIPAVLLGGCCQPNVPSATSAVAAPLITNRMPSLTHGEVLAKFRERASAAEIGDFERLSAAGDTGSQIRATEMVLFKLTTAELFRVGITQTGEAGNFYWSLATSTDFTDGGKSFETALTRVGVKASGVMELGIVGWYVPREQFFVARRALLDADLRAKEIRIIEPLFHLR